MNVGIVIVSHSPKVAEGTADMVRQMVGDEVPLAWCGGNPEGGLGTSVGDIMEAIDRAWSDAGVAILVDLGGAEFEKTIFQDANLEGVDFTGANLQGATFEDAHIEGSIFTHANLNGVTLPDGEPYRTPDDLRKFKARVQ